MGRTSYSKTSSSFEIHTHKIDRKHASVQDKLNIDFVPQKKSLKLTVGQLINKTGRNVGKMPEYLPVISWCAWSTKGRGFKSRSAFFMTTGNLRWADSAPRESHWMRKEKVY
jgi:hypothetical protein